MLRTTREIFQDQKMLTVHVAPFGIDEPEMAADIPIHMGLRKFQWSLLDKFLQWAGPAILGQHSKIYMIFQIYYSNQDFLEYFSFTTACSRILLEATSRSICYQNLSTFSVPT